MSDEEIEKVVLYYIIFKNEECMLTDEDFGNILHKKIIKAVNKLKSKKEEVSMLTIRNVIDEKSVEILKYLSDLGEYIFSTSFKTAYDLLKKYTKKRQILNLVKQIHSEIESVEEIDNYIERNISCLQKIEMQTETENNLLNQTLNTLKFIEEKTNEKKDDYSLYTGFFDLDALTDGLHNGEFTVIGARPGVGKTTFALQIAEKIASREKNIAFVSLEMSDVQLITKMTSKIARVNSRKIRNGSINDEEVTKITQALSQISEMNFVILTKSSTIQQIEIEARRLKNKNRLDLLVIDYLQLVRNVGNFTNREQQVSDISRTLKLLSLELDIPIIALCQLNRNASKAEPTLADLRESGAIEQDADNVILLYPKDVDNNIITVDLQKQRAGNVGTLDLKFNKINSEFINIER